jgi:hypothetical protein
MIYLHQHSINWTEILTAIGTIGLAFITFFLFFYDKIKKFLNRPILKVDINFHPPECHKTIAKSGGKIANAYWFRLFIKNEGKSTAKNLEVFIEKVEKKIGEKWQIYPAFLPSNLLWTHINFPLLPNLLPDTKKNVDFGSILDPKVRYSNPEESNPLLENNMTGILFNVTISVYAFARYNIINPGDYLFYIIVGASNCKSKRETFQVTFFKDWHDDESKMLNETIKISKI